MKKKTLNNLTRKIAVVLAALTGWVMPGMAVDFHVATAQDLQNALTLAAANGADDFIYVAAGYYTGNFNFNSTENRSLLLQGEAGITNTQITIDGTGTGRSLNLTSTGTSDLTVRGITFIRNCGSASVGTLRIAASVNSTLLVDSCRFLSPTNGGAVGKGLEIVSGQNAIVTNCVVIGKVGVAVGGGVSIAVLTGNITVGGCIVSSNSFDGGYGSGYAGIYAQAAGNVSIVASTFIGNQNKGAAATSSATLVLLNNFFIANGSHGAELTSTNMVVAGNTFRNNVYLGCYLAGNGGSVLLSNNVFVANSGGGAYIASATVTVIANAFSGNNANAVYGTGGGLYWGGAKATITGNTFTGNIANNGGGLAVNGSATIAGNTFTGNSGNNGGGLNASGTAIITTTNNTFTGNSATTSGGGAYVSVSGGTNVFSANILKQNSAPTGGGLYTSGGSSLILLDNLVVKNTQGGGIYVNPSSLLTVINNTITDNAITGNGGGLACSVSGVVEVLNVYDNIIWGNAASGNGADVSLSGTGFRKTFLNNDVHGMSGVWDIAANNQDVAPVFFDPVNGDYHLRSTSTCIDAGTNGVPLMPVVDLDGNTRTNAAFVDLGAYEFNNTLYHPADVNLDWTISATEYTNYAAAWKISQPWPSGPSKISADYVTRAGFLLNQGGTYHNDGAGAPLNWKPGS